MRPGLRMRHREKQLGDEADGLEVLGAVDDPGAVLLLDRSGLQLGVLGRLGEEVEAEICIRLVDGDRGEVEIVVEELGQEVFPLRGRHAHLEPVARAPGRQHEVVGRADVARGQFLGDEAGGQMIGEPRAAVLLRQHERAEAEQRALLQQIPGDALLPGRLLVELERLLLDLVLREVPRELTECLLLLAQTYVEHGDLPGDEHTFLSFASMVSRRDTTGHGENDMRAIRERGCRGYCGLFARRA